MKNTTLKSTLLLATGVLTILISSPRAEAAKTCRIIFKSAVPERDIRKQHRAGYESTSVEAYRELLALKENWPKLAKETRLLEVFEEMMRDEEMSAHNEVLQDIFLDANDPQLHYLELGKKDPVQALVEATANQINENMTIRSADARAEGLRDPRLTKARLMDIIGVSQKEAFDGLVGPRGIRELTKTSVVGEYIKDVQENRDIKVKTFVGRFRKGPDTTERGEPRLFVSVDAATVEFASKWFGSNRHFLAHKHDPGQGTLVMHHAGMDITYAGNNMNEAPIVAERTNWSSPVGTIVPLIVLSTTEASRTLNYFDLGALTSSSRAKYPWSLKNGNRSSSRSYCRPGGYTSCTHWVGEMPIGDKRVDKYTFPGQFDDHAGQADPSATNQRALRTGPVGKYTHFLKPDGRTEPVGDNTRVDRLTRMVWKEGQGNEQLWQMLDAREPLRKGEFANPGWVAYTLLAHAPAERVPVVLVMREDASRPLTQAEIDSLKTHIDPI